MKSGFVALSTVIALVAIASANKPDYMKHAMSALHLASDDKDQTLSVDAPKKPVAVAEVEKPAVFVEIKRSARAQLDPMETAATTQKVDESALRYFASRGDTARLQAEISRLKALYPDWTPPKDPLAIPQNDDKQLEAMWQLYSQARYAEVRKAIADRQTADPAWQPPADLLDRLNVAEARTRIINASDLKQYETVVRVGAETPSLLTCSEVDVLWRLAEAFFYTDKPQRSADAYGYILSNCDNTAERLATVQKAAALLPAATVENLLAKEKALPDGKMEFDSIRDDLARRFVAEANKDGKAVVPSQYLMRLEKLSETQALASDALLLGWYYLPRGDMEAAEKWFRKSNDKEDSASASQGLALVLIDRGLPLDAEDVMYTWRDASDEANAVYHAATANLLAVDPPLTIKADILKRVAAETTKKRDAATAQQFGWYARALNQPQTAVQWFKTALGWKLDDEPSAYGLAVTYLQLEDKQGVAEVQRLWSGRSERIARLGEKQTQPTVSADESKIPGAVQPAGNARPAVAETVAVSDQAVREVRIDAVRKPVVRRGTTTSARGCRTTIDPRTLSPDAALSRGWCLMEINRPLEAAAAFDIALSGTSTKTREDASYGQSLAYLRAGLSSKAAVAAVKTPQSRARAYELQKAILADKAIAAFDGGRPRETILVLDQLKQITPERKDLMSLRGYAYLKLKRYGDARQIFEALAAVGDKDGLRGLATINSIMRE